MLFRLSLKNMKKSFKDYAIYFITLVLGVAIFYMFNSLDSQQAMLDVSKSQKEIIKVMINILSIISVFVAVVLGLLIVYANNFLINRRKKEFGIYMTLGMRKSQISKIILFETILVGILSLATGLVIGIFTSQFMSLLVAKLFETNMTKFKFVFSKDACIKTCIYFAVMYIAVIVFNTITISKYKLINLLTAVKKNEKIKIKNPIISILVFLISVSILGYAYWKVTGPINTISQMNKILSPILMGVLGTVGVFWSLSGFILRIAQSIKKIYLKGTNMFVLRQLNNKINTTVISMSVICLMLFLTISILSSSLALQNTMQKDLIEMTPVDLNLYKEVNLPDKYIDYRTGQELYYTQEQKEDSKITIEQTLKSNKFNTDLLKDVVEIPIYEISDMTWETFFHDNIDSIKAKVPHLAYGTAEELVKVSDYNKIAKLYGLHQYELKDNEYVVICDFDDMKNIRDAALKNGNSFKINGKELIPKYDECKSGFIKMSTSHINTGIILVPDSCDLKEEQKKRKFLIANYNTNTNEGREEIEKNFSESTSQLMQSLKSKKIELYTITKINIIESSTGITTIVVFIAIYLGIIFLIASSAILALKQLTESSDNKQRYIILRKIGCDEKMINQALFSQIGIFFILPLILAIIHSIFGIQFALNIMSALANKEQLITSVISTIIIMGVVYGLYFFATYFGSKNIIRDEE